MLLTGLGTVFLFLGIAIGWFGLRPLAVLPWLLRSDVREPSALTTDEFVVCRGIATESGETLSAPFTGARCFGLEFHVTERQPFGIGLPWFRAHLDDGVATVPFTLDGDHGAVDVTPSSKRFSLDTDPTVVTVGATETPPERIEQFVDVRDELPPTARWLRAIPGLGTRRYVEHRIDPGEEYVVAGRTERRHGAIVLAGDLVIADRSPGAVAVARLRRGAFPLLVAGVFLVGGVWGLLA